MNDRTRPRALRGADRERRQAGRPAEAQEGGPALALRAKQAFARRRGQGGAVMFIVAMTLAVIAAMGVYALKIAADEVKTSGFVRQQVQTQYLAEFGVASMAQALSGPNTELYNALMMTKPDTGCFSLYGISATSVPPANAQSLACHRAGSAEIALQLPFTGALLTPYAAANTDVGRGSVGLSIAPDFYVEVTDPNQRQPPPGFSTNSNLCFVQFTASSMGVTPTLATTNAADTFVGSSALYGYQSEGLQVARARILGGPVTCTGTN